MNLGPDPLAGVALVADLTPAERHRVAAIFTPRAVAAGTVIIHEGATGDDMFVLLSGTVRVVKSMVLEGLDLPLPGVTGQRKVLATLSGDQHPVFGEMALLDQDIRSATVEVISDARFLVTDRDRFFAFVRQEPALGVKLLAALGRCLAAVVRRGNGDVVKLTTALALALGRRAAP